VRQTTSETDAPDDTFPISGLPDGAVVSVTVTPDDGTLTGSPATGSGTIADQPPVATVSLGGSLQVGGRATAAATATDPEGDPVTLTYVWLINGAQMKVDVGRRRRDSYFVPAWVPAGETITVRVVPDDGFVEGAAATASAQLAAAPTQPKSGPGAGGGTGAGPSSPGSAGGSTAGSGGSSDDGGYDPSTDPYSMQATTLESGARNWWKAGYTGKGVDVAEIDTGVSPVAGLNGAGKIVYGPDLSLESQDPSLTDLDTNGHGTFLAGLIAGDDPVAGPDFAAPASDYLGMAPDARIVSLKVGDADGGVDVTQVIAAIDWVVQHAHDDGLDIRVLNLAYGTNSTQPYTVDPLAFAVEQAWKAGIVVVAAAGNTGFQEGAGAPGVADPGYDPFVITAGGYDTMGTPDPGDDAVGGYTASPTGCASQSSRAPAGPSGSTEALSTPLCRGPDFLAIGSHLQGLRDPGSYIDQNDPDGRLGTRYFRGSGTSEATAITSGAVALILQRYPNLTPDQVKAFLVQGANPLADVDPPDQGAGELDLAAMLGEAPPSVGMSAQDYQPSDGSGTIEGSRGSDHLTMNGVELTGEEDIFGQPIDTVALAALEAADASWSGGTWNGSAWTGTGWTTTAWAGSSWSGNSWSGTSWSGNSWSGNSWSGNSWSGNSWSGNSWSGNSWSGNSWSGNSWSGNSWSSASWS
jgi:serine protease AprX